MPLKNITFFPVYEIRDKGAGLKNERPGISNQEIDKVTRSPQQLKVPQTVGLSMIK